MSFGSSAAHGITAVRPTALALSFATIVLFWFVITTLVPVLRRFSLNVNTTSSGGVDIVEPSAGTTLCRSVCAEAVEMKINPTAALARVVVRHVAARRIRLFVSEVTIRLTFQNCRVSAKGSSGNSARSL